MTHTTEGLKHRYRLCTEPSMIRKSSPLYTGVEFYDTYCDKWRSSIIEQAQLIPLKGETVVTAAEIFNCESAEQTNILMESKGLPRGEKVNFKTHECDETGNTHVKWEIMLWPHG